VVWDPVDTEVFKPRARRLETLSRLGIEHRAGNVYVLTLGRITSASRYKGYDRFLDVLEAIDDPGVIGLIAGDGDDRPRLEARARQLGVHERTHFLGRLSDDLLPLVYDACDVFMLVSEAGPGQGEGVPLTPLEAAACGKPIVVGNEDGSPEAVEHGVTGLVVSPRSLESQRGALASLIGDPALRDAMGRAARDRIEREFSLASFTARTRQALAGLQAS
jgi:phosphatidylinositol alpha-1,6-mannosyltransferase